MDKQGPKIESETIMDTGRKFAPAVMKEKDAAYYFGMSCGFLRRCRMEERTKIRGLDTVSDQ
tara:strand:+ start:593 stop:778 length:186 start_codon:yes stop_codon:yes gene_type:complete